MLQVYEREGISLIEVYKRVGKSFISVCKMAPKGSQMRFMSVRSREHPTGLSFIHILKKVHLKQLNGMPKVLN